MPEPSSIDVVAEATRAEGFDFAGMSSPDGALTLLLAGIENLEEIRASLGEERSRAVVDDYAALVRKLVETHFGQVVKCEGDGFMCSFASAHAAARCAIDIQRTFTSGEAAGAPRVRIGVHSGFVIEGPDAFMGRNVVLAARIANHAKGGEILVSSNTHEYTSTDPSLAFEAREEVHFKGVLGEHALFALRHQ